MPEWINALSSIDQNLFLYLNTAFAHPLLDWLMRAVTTKQNWYIPGGLVWLILIIKGGQRERTLAILIILAIIVSDQFTSSFLKPVVGRLRPCKSLEGLRLLVHCGSKYGFPSSHASNASAIGMLFLLNYRRFRPFWIVLIILVGVSRVYVGVHFPGDVLAGWLIGAGIACALYKISERYSAILWRKIGGTATRRFGPRESS